MGFSTLVFFKLAIVSFLLLVVLEKLVSLLTLYCLCLLHFYLEIAVGVYQPNHIRPGNVFHESDTNGQNQPPWTRSTSNQGYGEAHGDIFKFRMALWREHLNTLDPVVADPWTPECSRFT